LTPAPFARTFASMVEIEAAASEVQRLENAVLRAAVKRFYLSEQVSDSDDVVMLQQNLSDAVDSLVRGLPAVPFVKRNGG